MSGPVEHYQVNYQRPSMFDESDNMPADPEQAGWDEHDN